MNKKDIIASLESKFGFDSVILQVNADGTTGIRLKNNSPENIKTARKLLDDLGLRIVDAKHLLPQQRKNFDVHVLFSNNYKLTDVQQTKILEGLTSFFQNITLKNDGTLSAYYNFSNGTENSFTAVDKINTALNEAGFRGSKITPSAPGVLKVMSQYGFE